jgi:CRISPR-associated protein Csb1
MNKEMDNKFFDDLLEDDGPAVLMIREHLMSVEGADGVVFPPTYPKGDKNNFKGGYNIDRLSNEKNICQIDSVGSQANRIEPIFEKEKYKELVPQVTIKVGEEEISILKAGHRAADALIRCSSMQDELREVFKKVLKGQHWDLAKIAPTSLVFGVWDSRDTQVKLPRIVESTIRAFDVNEMTRSAVYFPPVNYEKQELVGDKNDKDRMSKVGLVAVPSTGTHGGVIARGGIKRVATLNLRLIRELSAGSKEEDKEHTNILKRYILGLSLVAFTYPASRYLRQGCNLVLDSKKPCELYMVLSNGKKENYYFTHEDSLSYAEIIAGEFFKACGEGYSKSKDRDVQFDKKRVNDELEIASEEKGNKKTTKAKK